MTILKIRKNAKRAAAAFMLLCILFGITGPVQAAASGIMPLSAMLYTGGYVLGGEVPVSFVNASSTLQEQGYDHSPANLCDKDTSTDWSEGAYGRGQGEWVELFFGTEVPVDSIVIYPGFWKSESLFTENCRPAGMTASFSDGSSVYFGFNDGMSAMTVVLSRTVKTSMIRFTVDSVYSGSKYQDMCISEIQVFSNDVNYLNSTVPGMYIVGSVMPDELNYGSPVDLGGTVVAQTGVLTEVNCAITDAKGNVVSSSTAYPMSFEHRLNTSVINDELKFGMLSAGSYKLKITARAVNGNMESRGLVAVYPFTVGSTYIGGASSSIGGLTPPTDYAYYGTAPFYGIWCEASQNYSGMVKLARQWEARGYNPRIVITTDWSGLNKESWYSLTAGVYYTRAEAEAVFNAVQSIYPTAYIKYTDTHR